MSGIAGIVPARRRELVLLRCDAFIESVVIEIGDAAMLQVGHDGRIPAKAHAHRQVRPSFPGIHKIEGDVLRRGVEAIFAGLNQLR